MGKFLWEVCYDENKKVNVTRNSACQVIEIGYVHLSLRAKQCVDDKSFLSYMLFFVLKCSQDNLSYEWK